MRKTVIVWAAVLLAVSSMACSTMNVDLGGNSYGKQIDAGVKAYKAGNYQQAEGFFKGALAEARGGPGSPDSKKALYWLSVTAFELKKYEEAESYLERALAIEDNILGDSGADLAGLLERQGEIYFESGNRDKAERLLKEALRVYEQRRGADSLEAARVLNSLGMLHYKDGNHILALREFERSLKIKRERPGTPKESLATSCHNAGVAYSALGRRDQALDMLGRALRLRSEIFGERSPEAAITLNAIGNVYMAQGDFGQAETYYKNALNIDRSYPEARHNLALVYRHKAAEALAGQDPARAVNYLKQSIGYFKMAVEKRPNAESYYEVAKTLLRLSEIVEGDAEKKELRGLAESSLELALARDPDFCPALAGLATLKNDRGKKREALALMDRALEADPKDPMVYYLRGYILEEMDRPREALENFDRCLKVMPHNGPCAAGRIHILIEFEELCANPDCS